MKFQRVYCAAGHLLSADNVRVEVDNKGRGHNRCIVCDRARKMRWYDRHRRKTKVSTPVTVDAVFENHGTLILLRPFTAAARAWVEDYLPEDRQTIGDAVAIEPRYVSTIYDAMNEYGLVVRHD